MKITGELLKAERTNQNLSVQDVAQSLKLSSKIITSLEAGQTNDLPAKTFVRGFVKSYAKLLKLDVDSVMRQFQEEMGSTIPLPKTPPPPAAAPTPTTGATETITATKPSLKQTSQNYSNKTPRPKGTEFLKNENSRHILLLMVGAVVLIVAIVAANKLVEKFSDNPITDKATPVTTPAATAAANTSVPTSADSSAVATSADGSDTMVAPEIADDSSSDDSDTSIDAPSDPASGKEVAKNVSALAAPEAGFQISNGKPVEVLIEAKKDIEVYYAKAGVHQFSNLKISANQIQILRAKSGLYVKISDGSAVKISVNGAEVSSSPTRGKDKELKLTF